MTGWRGARLAPAVLLAPALLPFALFVLYPLAASVALSFQDWDGIGERVEHEQREREQRRRQQHGRREARAAPPAQGL